MPARILKRKSAARADGSKGARSGGPIDAKKNGGSSKVAALKPVARQPAAKEGTFTDEELWGKEETVFFQSYLDRVAGRSA